MTGDESENDPALSPNPEAARTPILRSWSWTNR